MSKSAQNRRQALTATQLLGALALLVVAAVHFQQYTYQYYSRIPTIGPLFLLNFISAAGLGLVLLVPLRTWFGRRGQLLDELAALAGIAVSGGALVALLISEQTPLFGFMESGYRFAIVLAIASEAAAIGLLSMYLGLARNRAHRARASFVQASDADPLHPGPGTPAAQR